MQFNRKSLWVLVSIGMIVGAGPTLVRADAIYSANLDGDFAGTGSTATGRATFTMNVAETEVFYVIEFSGLTGSETGAHIHNGAPGLVGPRLLVMPLGSPKVGVWPVNAYEVAELNAGRVYINIHTDVYTTGEIGGQVAFDAVSTEPQAWGSLKALFR